MEYECFPANIDEKAIRSEDPEVACSCPARLNASSSRKFLQKLVLALANAKADALLQRHCKDGKWCILMEDGGDRCSRARCSPEQDRKRASGRQQSHAAADQRPGSIAS